MCSFKMKLFNKVAIVGTGLIGGSLALSLKKKNLVNKVIGVSRHKSSLLLAKRIGAIDQGSQDIHIIKDVDLVILSTPVSTILNLALPISKIIRPECIVTDVGSTKQEIVAKLERIFPNYIGSHPLAGSEKQGVINAHPGMFKDSLCILTPTKNTDKRVQDKIKKLWTEIGAKSVFLTPQIHDKILSYVSHLPHIAAFALITTIPRRYLIFGSSGLKDITRIATSDSRLWCDIFLSNQKNITQTIDLLQENLSQIKLAIIRKDKKLLNLILKEAKKKRLTLG